MNIASAITPLAECCDGNGRIWNNADETSGQWVSCETCAVSSDLRERLLASYILTGETARLPDAEDYYSTAEWRDAARYAADCDDYSELAFMVRRAELHADWRESPFDGDFSTFLNIGNFDAGARHPDRGMGL